MAGDLIYSPALEVKALSLMTLESVFAAQIFPTTFMPTFPLPTTGSSTFLPNAPQIHRFQHTQN